MSPGGPSLPLVCFSPLLFLTASVVRCWEAGTGLGKSWLSRGGGEPADATINVLSKLMDETITKLQREVKVNRIYVLIVFWIVFSSQFLRCRTDQAFLWGCWCGLHTVLFLKKEKDWFSLFSTLCCSQSSSLVLSDSVLCLDRKSDLNYCHDAAREKRGSCKHLWCQGAQACKGYPGSGLVISSVCPSSPWKGVRMMELSGLWVTSSAGL